jgi:hypothetical protein
VGPGSEQVCLAVMLSGSHARWFTLGGLAGIRLFRYCHRVRPGVASRWLIGSSGRPAPTEAESPRAHCSDHGDATFFIDGTGCTGLWLTGDHPFHDRFLGVPTRTHAPRGLGRGCGHRWGAARPSGREARRALGLTKERKRAGQHRTLVYGAVWPGGHRDHAPRSRCAGREDEVQRADGSGGPRTGGIGPPTLPPGRADRPTCAQAGWGDRRFSPLLFDNRWLVCDAVRSTSRTAARRAVAGRRVAVSHETRLPGEVVIRSPCHSHRTLRLGAVAQWAAPRLSRGRLRDHTRRLRSRRSRLSSLRGRSAGLKRRSLQ